jgi:hypothetical protein
MSDFFERIISVVERPSILAKEGEFWTKKQPRRDRDGLVVRGGMWEHQKQWWELDTFIKALVGGFGCGKTLVLGKRMISLALQNAPCPVATVSPSFPIARHTIIPTIQELLSGKESKFGRAFWWRYNRSTHEFKIRYHGREASIICYSGDNPLSLRGPNLAAVGIDEPFLQDEDVFHQMIARVRHPLAKHLEMCLTGTPEQLNWGYDLCQGELRDRHDVGLVHASTRKNLALDPDYVGRLEASFAEKAADAYIEGRFVNLGSGLVYYPFSPMDNVCSRPMPRGARLGCGMDFNVDPMAAIVFWVKGNHIHFFHETEQRNCGSEEMADYLTEEFGNQLVDIYPDPSGRYRHTNDIGKSDFYNLEKSGYTVYAHSDHPRVRDRENAVNGKLRSRDGRVTATIDPSCKKLIKYLSLYSHELKQKPKQVAMSHLIDAMGYPVEYLFPVDKESIIVTRFTGV